MASQCVCVTGSTQGIGYGVAEAFAREGARLIINSHLQDDTAAKRLSALTEVHFVKADLSTVVGAQTLIDTAWDKLGQLDALVCNAGTFRDTEFLDLDEEAVDATFDLNIKGPLFCAQAFARRASAAGHNGSIILTGSTNSLAAERNSVAYDASKGAVLMLVRSLAVSLAPLGIRVNGVAPGIIETPLTRPGLDAGETRQTLRRQIPLGRIGMPDDIGGTAVFLASDAARYITGQMVYVDGGILAMQMNWDGAA